MSCFLFCPSLFFVFSKSFSYRIEDLFSWPICMRKYLLNFILQKLCKKAYKPDLLSQIAINSLENNRIWIKANRLSGRLLSITEAETLVMTTGKLSIKRIVIWLDEYNNIILIDWRHLLDAYRVLDKPIPHAVISFESPEAKKVFTSKMK
jgi:hypothetical protein